MLSVVIPTFNAAARLAGTLECLRKPETRTLIGEIIVADGGSSDSTLELAYNAGVKVVTANRGRGEQLAAGANAAEGRFLLFLHADTLLRDGWVEAASDFIADPANGGRAGVFRFKLDDDSAAARRLERIVAWRTEQLGLPYGDQALLISSEFYRRLGGYASFPIMEDVDFIRRIGRRRIILLAADAITSATRYRAGGYFLRSMRNLTLLILYFAGVSPNLLVRFYESGELPRQRK